jgi:hypothetical protein
MAKNSSGITAFCACGAVECDGSWTKSEAIVAAGKKAGILPIGMCCECSKNGVLFGGFMDHSTIGCCMS